MSVLLIARFAGDPGGLQAAYDRAHRRLVTHPGPPVGELRHHCAIGDDALYLIGVWKSEAHIRARFGDPAFVELLQAEGFPPPSGADLTILRLHVSEPPLPIDTVGC